jgi:hypothetical protein
MRLRRSPPQSAAHGGRNVKKWELMEKEKEEEEEEEKEKAKEVKRRRGTNTLPSAAPR